jgi:hypothetical protein
MWALTILVPMSQVLGFLRVVEGPQTKLSLLFELRTTNTAVVVYLDFKTRVAVLLNHPLTSISKSPLDKCRLFFALN